MSETYRPKISQRNTDLLGSLADHLQSASDILFTDYQGLNVADIERLRSDLHKAGATMTVVKNRIARRALSTLGIDDACQSALVGPTAIIYSTTDSLPALKALMRFQKEHTQLVVKGALMQNVFHDQAHTETIASLPSQGELVTQLLFTLQSPITQMVRLLHTIISRPAIALSEIAKTKKIS